MEVIEGCGEGRLDCRGWLGGGVRCMLAAGVGTARSEYMRETRQETGSLGWGKKRRLE